MALHLQCRTCGTQALVPDCAPECAAVEGAHLSRCPGADLDSLLTCPPDSGCCQEDHHHGAAADACPLLAAGTEHVHAPGTKDCTACRPITITWYAGGSPVMLQPATGG
jgi:hypothetical protein